LLAFALLAFLLPFAGLAFLPLLALAVLHLFQKLLQLFGQFALRAFQLAHQFFHFLGRQRIAAFALLALLAGLLLTALARAAALVELKRLVHQLLLLAHDVGELVHLLLHLRVALRHLPGLRHLEVVEHLLQLAQELLRRFLVAELRQILDAVEHLLDILLGQGLHVRVGRRLRVLHAALGHLGGLALQKLLHGLRSSSIRLAISSGDAPSSSAFSSASRAALSRSSASDTSPSSMARAMSQK
jgi:hypothetical protein